MSRIMRVAMREFASTALTPGFIIGAFVVPVLFIPLIGVIVFLINRAEPPADQGVIAVIDRSSVVVDLLEDRLSVEAITERKAESQENVGEKGRDAVASGDLKALAETADKAQQALASVPVLTIERLSATGTPEDIDAMIAEQQNRIRAPANRDDPTRLLALVVIDEHAVMPRVSLEAVLSGELEEGVEPYGSYELYQRPRVDGRTIDEVRENLAWSIREKRYEVAGIDRDLVGTLSRVQAPRSQEVTAEGTRNSSNDLQQFLPMIVIMLLFMGVMTGGQYLLTTTIEEKSSRVVELLLAAVSPMQLMAGKIFGQLGVGLSLLLIYNAMGLITLAVFERADLISGSMLLYMLVFFLLAYFQLGGFMGAIGAAVTELREAQSLMTPVVMILLVAFYLSIPVSRDPDATYAVVLSFIPPVSPFVMLTRIASTEPPPAWQAIVAIGINIVAAYGSIWAAAKIFRVGLLMYGKPPNVRTLIKWVWMA